MSFLSDWDDILESLEATRKKYGGTSIGASVAAGASGKGFRFPDEAAANKIAGRFRERAEVIEDRMDLIDRAQRSLAQKFSDDDVSVGYARQAMDSLAKLGELNESAFKYTMRYVEKIELATKKKREEDDAASDAARNHARQVG